MANNDIFKVMGLTDMQKKMEYVVKNYPNDAETLLKKTGNKFRKDVKNDTPIGPHKRKKLINSYKVSDVKGYGKDLYIEFNSNSPHYHLVERGHRIVSGGKLSKANDGQHRVGNGRVAGRVEGREMVKRNIERYTEKFPDDVEKMIDKFIKDLIK